MVVLSIILFALAVTNDTSNRGCHQNGHTRGTSCTSLAAGAALCGTLQALRTEGQANFTAFMIWL